MVAHRPLFPGPGDAAGQVLEDQGRGSDQRGDEAAARGVVAAQEQVDRDEQGERQEKTGHLCQVQGELFTHRLVAAAAGPAAGRQPQPFEQGVDGEGGDGQHRDLAQGVEAAEIHQDDVDHVGPAAAGQAVGQEKVGNGGRRRPGEHGPGEQAGGGAQGERQHEVTQPPPRRGFHRGALRQEEQGEQQQDDGHHLDGQLGEGQVRRGKADKGERAHQPDHAQGNEGEETAPVPAHGEHRAGDHGQPAEQGEAVQRYRRRPDGRPKAADERYRHGRGRGTEQQRQRALQGAVGGGRGPAPGRTKGALHQLREQAVRIDSGEELGVQGEQLVAHRVQADAEDQGGRAHGQRQVEPVPHGQVEGGQGRAEHACGGEPEEGRHGQAGEDADDQAVGDEDHQRQPHQPGGVVGRVLGQVDRLAVEEHVVDEAGRVGHREDAGQGGRGRQEQGHRGQAA